MEAIIIGNRIRQGTYRLHSRFDHAINFTDGHSLVSLVTPDVGAGPVNIVVTTLPRASVPPAPLAHPQHGPPPTRETHPELPTSRHDAVNPRSSQVRSSRLARTGVPAASPVARGRATAGRFSSSRHTRCRP